MKKTTYILLALVGMIFVVELPVGLYLYSTRMSWEEYRAMHPEWDEAVTLETYIDDETEEEEQQEQGATVIDASDGGYNVIISSEYTNQVKADSYYTDTIIITSSEKNIRVIR